MEMEITIKIKKDKEEREYELKDGEWVEIVVKMYQLVNDDVDVNE